MNALVMLSATEQSKLLERREISSVELTQAHLDRIEAIDGRIHAFTEVLRDRALADARRADEAITRGDRRGPLHGLPITIKESLEMAGHVTTLGLPSRVGQRSTRDAAVVSLFRETGCVMIGRTNVSQLLIFHESRNPVFGQTSNPFSDAHTPGGSSGGEAAAIASGMSPLGLGTDIGGSIRVPAHFSGICGLKPTLDRWPNAGSKTGLAGQEAIRGQCGPMARTTADLVLAMSSVDMIRASQLDPRTPPLSFDDPSQISIAGKRVGLFTDDGWVPPSHAVTRAVERAGKALRARGCEVIAFTPPETIEAITLYFAALASDGGKTVAALLEGGSVDLVVEGLRKLATLPKPIRAAAAKVAHFAGEERVARLLRVTHEKTVSDLWALTARVRDYRARMLDAMDAAKIDALICPAHANPALPHTLSRDYAMAGSTSMLFNFVQFPAGVLPITTVRADETSRASGGDRLDRRAAEVDAKSTGLPVGVQVVGRPWAESTVLALMGAIEAEVQNDEGFPRTPVPPIAATVEA